MTTSVPAEHTSSPSRGRRLLVALATAGLVAGLGITGAPTALAADTFFCSDGTQPYVPAAEVESFDAGTAVTGLSVTHGTSPDPFTGTYVGFVADALGKGKDLLLFRLSSSVIDGTEASGGLKGAGIWAGMSGSPVYASDGRLIGAVSYGTTTENLPIAGVTPAEYMKTIGTTALTASARVKVTAANLSAAATGAKAAASLVGATFSPAPTVNVAGAAGTKQNAFANRTLARTPRTAAAAQLLRSGTFLPAAAQSAALTQPLVPGGTVAAMYSTGDLIVGAVGTVTAVCGDTVWAFGHPMDFEGKTRMAMANASTAMIVPDAAGLTGSYKLVSQFGPSVGMFTEDRKAGIRGTVGAVDGFGIDVAVQNASGASAASYHSDVVNPEAAASVVAGLIGTAAYEQLDQYSTGTAKVTWAIDFRREDGSAGQLTNDQIVAETDGFPDIVGTATAEDLWAIVDNPFEDVTVTGVRVTLKLLSADALSYRASGVQLQGKTGKWTSLSGSKLTAGGTYSIRPTYTLLRNGKSRGTVTGAPVTVKLSSKARQSGSIRISAASQDTSVCDGDSDECDDWDATDTSGYADFDDLLAGLDDLQSADKILGQVRYRLKKGSTSRTFTRTGPGVVTGSTTVGFLIRH